MNSGSTMPMMSERFLQQDDKICLQQRGQRPAQGWLNTSPPAHAGSINNRIYHINSVNLFIHADHSRSDR